MPRTVLIHLQSQYHTYCPVDYSNYTSEQLCWLGDTNVPLPDLDTTNPTVISGFSTCIKELVSTYQFDGLRIDAAKYVDLLHYAIQSDGLYQACQHRILARVLWCRRGLLYRRSR